jgi:acyl carrier protein
MEFYTIMDVEDTKGNPKLDPSDNHGEPAQSSQNQRTPTEIQNWLVSYLSELLEIEPDEVEVTVPFERYGLDSSAAIGLSGDLEDWLGFPLDPTLLYDYPTIEALVQHLAQESQN